MKPIHEQLADAARRRGVTHQQIADAIGDHRSTVTARLSGARPMPAAWIELVCAAIGVEVVVRKSRARP